MNDTVPGTGGPDGALSGQVVPFGKYKGRSVAELVSDDSYREWVLSQPWVRERYVNFYQVLIHGGPPPQDSPEHNEMQARFLDDNWCLSLARLFPGLADHGLREAVDQAQAWQKKNLAANPQIVEALDLEPPIISHMQMENRGWDVTFEYEPALLAQTWECQCELRTCGCWRSAEPVYPGGYRWDLDIKDWADNYHIPRKPEKPYIPKPSPPVEPLPHNRTPWGYQDPYLDQRYEQQLAEYPGKLTAYRVDLAEYPAKLAEAETRYREELAEYEKRLACYTNDRHVALDHRERGNEFQIRRWPSRIAAELKPDLGDDYPNVLRQVSKYMTRRVNYGRGQYGDEPTCDAAFVVARRARFTSVTWDQVRQIFGKSGILLVSESSLGSGQPL